MVLFGDPILKAREESDGSEESSLVRDRSSGGMVQWKILTSFHDQLREGRKEGGNNIVEGILRERDRKGVIARTV